MRKSVLPWYFPCSRHSRRSGAHLGLGQYTYPPPPPMSDPTATQGWYGGYSYGQTSKSSTPSMDPRGLRHCLQDRIMRPSRSTKLLKSILEVSCSRSQCRRPSSVCRIVVAFVPIALHFVRYMDCFFSQLFRSLSIYVV